MHYQELLTPENLNSVKGLELIAKTILDGHHSGLNRSRKVGQGMEFSQYRSYEPGDDLRLLDWKMLARSSRYYIKQAEIDTSIAIRFIIDSSASMKHTDNGFSKIDYCRFLCATLGYLAKHQGDAIGLFSLNDQQLTSLYPKARVQHFNRFLHQLVEVESKGRWPDHKEAVAQLHDGRHKELIIFLSDMYEEDDELSRFLSSIKTKRNEVILLHIMGQNELQLSYAETSTFQDLESNERIKIENASIKKEYLSNVESFLFEIKNSMLRSGIDYSLFSMETPIREAINLFIKRRSALL